MRSNTIPAMSRALAVMVLATLLLISVVPAPASSQAYLRVKVVDSQGNPLPGATLTLDGVNLTADDQGEVLIQASDPMKLNGTRVVIAYSTPIGTLLDTTVIIVKDSAGEARASYAMYRVYIHRLNPDTRLSLSLWAVVGGEKIPVTNASGDLELVLPDQYTGPGEAGRVTYLAVLGLGGPRLFFTISNNTRIVYGSRGSYSFVGVEPQGAPMIADLDAGFARCPVFTDYYLGYLDLFFTPDAREVKLLSGEIPGRSGFEDPLGMLVERRDSQWRLWFPSKTCTISTLLGPGDTVTLRISAARGPATSIYVVLASLPAGTGTGNITATSTTTQAPGAGRQEYGQIAVASGGGGGEGQAYTYLAAASVILAILSVYLISRQAGMEKG